MSELLYICNMGNKWLTLTPLDAKVTHNVFSIFNLQV